MLRFKGVNFMINELYLNIAFILKICTYPHTPSLQEYIFIVVHNNAHINKHQDVYYNMVCYDKKSPEEKRGHLNNRKIME